MRLRGNDSKLLSILFTHRRTDSYRFSLFWSAEEAFFTMVAIGAPIIEETFKATVLLFFIGSMRSNRSGFLVGFSIGLGFALIENLQYIAVSLFGGPAELAVTTLVRGIGSIPAHALWTGIVGSAVGGFLRGSEINQIDDSTSFIIEVHPDDSSLFIDESRPRIFELHPEPFPFFQVFLLTLIHFAF